LDGAHEVAEEEEGGVAKLQALAEEGDASALFVLGLLWEV
jgi:hypothetical protein